MAEPVDCADHAIAFALGYPVSEVTFTLWNTGRPIDHDGTTDRQIASAIRILGGTPVTARTSARTLRTFAREKRPGAYLLFTTDHVVACVNGFLCDRPENSDLARLEKVWKII